MGSLQFLQHGQSSTFSRAGIPENFEQSGPEISSATAGIQATRFRGSKMGARTSHPGVSDVPESCLRLKRLNILLIFGLQHPAMDEAIAYLNIAASLHMPDKCAEFAAQSAAMRQVSKIPFGVYGYCLPAYEMRRWFDQWPHPGLFRPGVRCFPLRCPQNVSTWLEELGCAITLGS